VNPNYIDEQLSINKIKSSKLKAEPSKQKQQQSCDGENQETANEGPQNENKVEEEAVIR